MLNIAISLIEGVLAVAGLLLFLGVIWHKITST